MSLKLALKKLRHGKEFEMSSVQKTLWHSHNDTKGVYKMFRRVRRSVYLNHRIIDCGVQLYYVLSNK